ncbi:Structural maintenance of chromosomes protein 1 [Gaertneriomyces sp. JEL0708]|nr:Structural maintenance of chromosomes protein 1 [Gaertneriomyces sp. JEL0708]
MGRLVQLEVENFKSYRGKQIIGPFFNFTSVIGPNGSGKSNLMDAISFVLGVKSAQLRSAQLKELIYRSNTQLDSDSDDEGHPSRASVTAVYETSEVETIRFQRTINPNGSSEYKINDKTVTFARYSAALEEENVSIKAKNFLVFQGDVEAVAAQSPKDLTKMIEQISGSLELKPEYERLKALQEQATENSAHSFNKKRGINAEMKQFKEQKEEAERFEKLQRQKAKLTTTHLLWKLYHNHRRINTLTDEIADLKSSATESTEQLAELEAQLKDARKQHARTNKELLKLERRIAEKNKELDDRKPDLFRVEERIKHTAGKLKSAEENLAKAEKEAAKESDDIRVLQKDHDQLTKAMKKFESQLKKKQQESGGMVDTETLMEYHNKKEEVRRRTLNETEQITTLRRQRKAQEEQKARLDENMATFRDRKKALEDEEALLVEREEKLEVQLEGLKRELKVAKKEIADADIEKQKVFQQETEITEKLHETQSKLQQARVDRHESERETKQKEMLDELKKAFSGVHGRVVDLCKPTQRKYQLAISIILGRNLDSIVVDSEKTAIECIDYLREQRIGKATFLPLDTIKPKSVNERLRQLQGAHLALDVIQFEQHFEKAMLFSCGNALVVDTLEVAKEIAYEKRIEVKCVALDGTIIHKTGMITGGVSQGDNRNARRWDDREVENLQKAQTTFVAQLQEITKSRRKVFQDENLRSALTALESKMRLTTEDLTTTRQKRNAITTELEHILPEIAKVAQHIQSLADSLSAMEEEIQGYDATVQQVENEVFASFCRRVGLRNVREFEERRVMLEQEGSEKRMEFETQKAKVENQIEFEKSRHESSVERIRKIQKAIQTDQQRLKALEEERAEILEGIKDLEESIHHAGEQVGRIKEELETKQANVTAVKKEIAALNKEYEARNKAVAGLESEIEKLGAERFGILRKCKLEEIDIPLLEGNLEDVTLNQLEGGQGATHDPTQDSDAMDVDYDPSQSQQGVDIQIDFSGLKSAHKADSSTEVDMEFTEQLKALQTEIERLAPNMRAVQHLNDVEDKLKETAREFDEARRSAKEAKDAFMKIKQERYERFYAAYSHIAERIDEVYKELTRSKAFPMGGTAYLSLEDSEEPYNDGIKYHAMPPMKRFRDMELLSGGEKTVAALALLFAIHSYHPSPFFVLDEVDAALDNANVAKVANYIKNFSARNEGGCQFIVISLKSTFYENARGLVGIYREQGGSRVLTLDLGRFAE